ncbi:TetR/AcrR family transcriptional regulator [Spongisporangium articulatum]|uniref:TetR/AcrR family transcriptional regulator n=1 Tax=Spongisporangium articulatum TaxID=3362603 RepID=A0ABW8ATH1_9ACTN
MNPAGSRVGPTAPLTKSPRPTNPRSARTRATILATARQMIARDGVEAFSYAALATRLGVTRQTIYRYWPRREDLLRDAAIEGPDNYFLASSVEVRPILLEWVRNFAQRMSQPDAGAAVLELMRQAEGQAAAEVSLTELIEGRREHLNQLLIPTGYSLTSEDFSLLMGPVTSRRFLARAELTAPFLEAVVDQFLARPSARLSLPGSGPGPYPLTARPVPEEQPDDVRAPVSGS